MNYSSSDLRSKDTTNMLNYGFNSYQLNIIFNKEKDLGKIKLEKGKVKDVNIFLENDITILAKAGEQLEKYDYNIVVDDLNLPLTKNQRVGHVEIIDNEGNIIKEENLIIKENVEKANIWDLFKRTLESLNSGNTI